MLYLIILTIVYLTSAAFMLKYTWASDKEAKEARLHVDRLAIQIRDLDVELFAANQRASSRDRSNTRMRKALEREKESAEALKQENASLLYEGRQINRQLEEARRAEQKTLKRLTSLKQSICDLADTQALEQSVHDLSLIHI